jgi:CheY-like chemotaxis protein
MDCHMPNMDGFEATRKIRAEELEMQLDALPIIAVTALALDADQQRCYAAGMNAHLAKPFSAAQLARIISRAVGSAGQRKPPTWAPVSVSATAKRASS